MAAFGYDAQKNKLKGYKDVLTTLNNTKNAMTSKNTSAQAEEISKLIAAQSKLIDDLSWEIYKYEYNVTYTAERQTYLKTILNEEDCSDNAGLPSTLIKAYSQNGKNLKCPEGTTSERGSYCLGQCYRNT